MTESGERIESDCQEPECLRCEHHEEDEYNSWCNAGMPEHVREVFEGDGFDDPCPLRAALKERDAWKAKAERYRYIALDHAASPVGSHVEMVKQIEAVDGE